MAQVCFALFVRHKYHPHIHPRVFEATVSFHLVFVVQISPVENLKLQRLTTSYISYHTRFPKLKIWNCRDWRHLCAPRSLRREICSGSRGGVEVIVSLKNGNDFAQKSDLSFQISQVCSKVWCRLFYFQISLRGRQLCPGLQLEDRGTAVHDPVLHPG